MSYDFFRIVFYPASEFFVVIESLICANGHTREHHYRHFLGRWTSMGTPAPELHSALTIDLQRNVQRVLESAQGEVGYAFKKNVPDCNVWTSVSVFSTFLRISALLIERTWVGLPLSREETWIKATTGYMTDVAKAANAIRAWPKALRPLVAPMLAEVQSLKNNRDHVTKAMKPLIRQQFSSSNKEKGDRVAGGELFAWIIQRYKGAVTPERIARDELMATFSSLYTVTATLSQTLFDLAARPEYLGPLREELAGVLVEDPGLVQKVSLIKLKKMDSFIKESQRMNPLGLSESFLLGSLPSSPLIMHDFSNYDAGRDGPKGAQAIYGRHYSIWGNRGGPQSCSQLLSCDSQ